MIPEHPDTAFSLNNLARLLRQGDRPSDALPLFRRAIAVGDSKLGTDHPLMQRFKSNYARALLDAGQI